MKSSLYFKWNPAHFNALGIYYSIDIQVDQFSLKSLLFNALMFAMQRHSNIFNVKFLKIK